MTRDRLVLGLAVAFVAAMICIVLVLAMPTVNKAENLEIRGVRQPGMGSGNYLINYFRDYITAIETGNNLPQGNADIVAKDLFPQVLRKVIPGTGKRSGCAKYDPKPSLNMDASFFHCYRDELRKATIGEMAVPKVPYDVVVHVRMDDTFTTGNNSYNAYPKSYYAEAMKEISTRANRDLNVLVVYRAQKGTECILETAIAGIKTCPRVKKIDEQSKSSKEDFLTIMGAEYVIGSVGSFTSSAVFLSPHVKEFHLPRQGWNIEAFPKGGNLPEFAKVPGLRTRWHTLADDRRIRSCDALRNAK